MVLGNVRLPEAAGQVQFQVQLYQGTDVSSRGSVQLPRYIDRGKFTVQDENAAACWC